MINPISSNLNFRGNVTIGQKGEFSKDCKVNIAKHIATLGKNSNEQAEKNTINALNDFAKELAVSTPEHMNFNVRFAYLNGGNGAEKNDSMHALVEDCYTNEIIARVEKDLGGNAELGRPIFSDAKLFETIEDLFNETREKTFNALGFDKEKIEENKRINKDEAETNKHINEIFNMLA